MPVKRRRKSSGKIRCPFAREELILHFWQVIPSTLPAVEQVIRRILKIAQTMGCAKGELRKVELALREALINAVVHGSRGDPKKQIWVCCLCTEDKGMLLVVRDFGPGFDTSIVPDPTKAQNIYAGHGRGIFLMRELMDEVKFQKGGRQVVMKKTARQKSRRRST
jgi:serine/threonine-protein kinase RsbW